MEIFNAVPNLILLTILVLIIWYALKLIDFFFAGIHKGKIILSGFDTSWAKPRRQVME
jgi:hypothetical protein